jgi:lipoprotein-releasing system ATP-binding protein
MNNSTATTALITCTKITKTFVDGKLQTPVLHGIDLHINVGEQVAIVGSSGSGKSTLLSILGGLSLATSGQVTLDGRDYTQLSDNDRAYLRNHYLGFVYQFHHLLPEFTALENVAMPLLIRGETPAAAQTQAAGLLDHVGLSHRYEHKLAELSGGERQRVAIARALVTQPKCVLADEPTGNLDQTTAHQVYELMLKLNREMNSSIVIVTHDLTLARKMDRILYLEDGRITKEDNNVSTA